MTPTQQTKIAELLVNKLKQAQNKPFVEIIPQSEIEAEIQSKMVLAGVVYELMQDAYFFGLEVAHKANNVNDFEPFLNNIK
jgi:hypothetical protein